MNTRLVTGALCLVLSTHLAGAQVAATRPAASPPPGPKPFALADVWTEGKMPGLGAKTPEGERPPTGDNVRRIINVSRPTLEVFPAPKHRIGFLEAAKQSKVKPAADLSPTFAKVAYGEHPNQTLDFWKAFSDKPTAVVFYMHGGGWVKDDQSRPAVAKYLAAGISVVSIHYRYSWEAQIAGVKPPLDWPMHDAARALQFVRSKAAEWNIDKQRIGVSGQSAGACTCLWLAFHNDMADPKSSDPVSRESTRPFCAAVIDAQTSLDPQQMKEWTPNSIYGGGAFGFMNPKDIRTRDKSFAEFLAHRGEFLPWIKEYSPIEHVSVDDPPIYLSYKAPPAIGQQQKDPTHTANFGAKLKEKLDQLGVECELVYPAAPDVKHPNIEAYLIERLRKVHSIP